MLGADLSVVKMSLREQRVLMVKMPIINTPIKRIAMDVIGLLPTLSTWRKITCFVYNTIPPGGGGFGMEMLMPCQYFQRIPHTSYPRRVEGNVTNPGLENGNVDWEGDFSDRLVWMCAGFIYITYWTCGVSNIDKDTVCVVVTSHLVALLYTHHLYCLKCCMVGI